VTGRRASGAFPENLPDGVDDADRRIFAQEVQTDSAMPYRHTFSVQRRKRNLNQDANFNGIRFNHP
jgi:hypothetical protein